MLFVQEKLLLCSHVYLQLSLLTLVTVIHRHDSPLHLPPLLLSGTLQHPSITCIAHLVYQSHSPTKLEYNTNFFGILFHCVFFFPIMQQLNTTMGALNIFNIQVNDDDSLNVKNEAELTDQFVLVCVLL